MYRTLHRSRVTYNSHGDFAPHSASNRRLFESTGVASCLLTDHKSNISTLFEPDREVVTFTGTEDCIEKAKWLLAHPREAGEIAGAGQRRTLAEHTYARRAVELDAILTTALKRLARARQPA
jgi:spore maturation protein CgeB